MNDSLTGHKLLSITVTGRNDNYCGNFKYRLTTSLNYLARNLKRIGRLDDVEVLVTDWNSNVPLADVLLLNQAAAETCRFIRVPSDVAASKHRYKDQAFNIACAMNVAIRRAQGLFVIYLTADTLLPENSLQILFSFLEKKIHASFDVEACLFSFGAGLLTWDVTNNEPTLEELDRLMLLHGSELEYYKWWPGLGAGCGGFMLTSKIWHELRGFDERFGLYGGADDEMHLRACQRYPWSDLMNIGVKTYLLGHTTNFEFRASPARTGTNRSWKENLEFFANKENWGLKDFSLEISKSRNFLKADDQEFESPVALGRNLEGGYRQVLTQMVDRRVSDYLEVMHKKLKIPNGTEWYISCFIAWYAIHFFPRCYVDIGAARGYSAPMVLGACSMTECNIIESWDAKNSGPFSNARVLSDLLHKIGFRGYLRFVTGDPSTAFNRLQDSLPSPMFFDLVVFRSDLFKDKKQIVQQLHHILNYLSAKGVLLFCCRPKALFDEVLKDLKDQHPTMIFWDFGMFSFGIIFAPSMGGSLRGDLSYEEKIKLFRLWRGLKPSFFKRCVRWSKRIWHQNYENVRAIIRGEKSSQDNEAGSSQ